MKPTILLINFQDQQKLRKLKMALLPFKLRIKTIEPQDYSQPIGYLAGVKEVSQVQIPSALIPQEQMEKEMLILAGITGNLFLLKVYPMTGSFILLFLSGTDFMQVLFSGSLPSHLPVFYR